MKNNFTIQLVGLIISALGMLALIALTTIHGKPLSDDERRRLGKDNRSRFRLPINFETIIAALILLAGIGILTWSKFDLCVFITYWMPNLPDVAAVTLGCK